MGRLAMVPVIDSTKTMGIVFMLLAAVSLTATIVSLLTPGRLFTPRQLLRRLGASAGSNCRPAAPTVGLRPVPPNEKGGAPFGAPPLSLLSGLAVLY
jgi:hypothetical protein